MGVVPSVTEIEAMRAAVEEATDRTVFRLIGSDSDQHYLSIIALKDDIELVLDCVRQFGFNKVTFSNMFGTPVEITGNYEKELAEIAKEKEVVESSIASMTGEI